MSKVGVIAEWAIVINEVLETVSGLFSEAVSKEFYEMLNEITFLTVKFLGMNNSGDFFGETKLIADAVQNLSSIFLWGCFLFYGFNCLFSYFISKKVDLPWKAFVRAVIFTVLINASSFICFSGVFLSENITGYLREFVGDNIINFEIFEPVFSDINISEESDIFNFEVFISIFSYFSLFIISVLLAARFIILKILILTLPLFLSFGALKCTEKIFFVWGKCFFGMLFIEIIVCLMLYVFSIQNSGNLVFSHILICAMQFLLRKIIFQLTNGVFISK